MASALSTYLFLKMPIFSGQNKAFQEKKCRPNLTGRKKRCDSECHTVNLNKTCKYNENQPVFLRIAKVIALTKISTCSVNATEVERATF